MKIKADTTTSL